MAPENSTLRRKGSNFPQKSRIDHLLSRAKDLDHNLTRHEEDEAVNVVSDPGVEAAGHRIFHGHIFALFACMLSGLTTLMYVPSIVSVLKTTGLSANPMGSFVRYLSTINHVVEWFKTPRERMKSLKNVRNIHSKVNELLVRKGTVGQRMTQFDMVVTQWAFFGPAFIFAEDIGLSGVTEKELEGLAHRLYQIGYILGVRDEFNLCTGSLSEIRCYCRDIHEQIILPCLKNPTPLSKEMSKSMLQGAGLITPLIYVDAFEAWMFKVYRASEWEEKAKNIKSVAATIIFHLHVMVFKFALVWYPMRVVVRPILNSLMRLNIYLANYLKGKIIRDQHHQFITSISSKFWMAQTQQQKDIATTVGNQWLQLA